MALPDVSVPEKFHKVVAPFAFATRFHCQRTACPATVPVNSPLATGPVQVPVRSVSICTISHTGAGPFGTWTVIFQGPETLAPGVTGRVIDAWSGMPPPACVM